MRLSIHPEAGATDSSTRTRRRRQSIWLSLLLATAAAPASAALEPLLISGQPGIIIDANGNGQVDPGDGLITVRFDPDVDVLIFDIDANFGGGHVIYQITEMFNTQVLKEVAQYPLEGPAQFTNLRPPADFFTFFLDTIDFTPEVDGQRLLDALLEGR